MWNLIIYLLTFCVVSSFGAKCTFRFNTASPGIFTQKFGSKTRLLWSDDGLISFDDRSSINATCSSSFDDYHPYGSKTAKHLKFTCNHDNQVQFSESSGSYNYDTHRRISCRTGAQYWEADVKGCNLQGFAFGFFANNLLISLAEICYHPDIQRTMFIRYLSGARSPLLENQGKYDSANLTFPVVDVPVDVRLDDEKQLLAQAIKSALPNYGGEKMYEIDDLMPLSGMGFLKQYGKDLESTNKIAWWIPLKYGNWKLVEEIIKKESTNMSLEIYTGVSGKITYPVNDKCESVDVLTYGNEMFRKSVPLYVWNYVRPLDSEEDKGFVILGINSPFFDVSAEANKPFCEDICNTIEWLGFLNKMRKLPGLGYIFCCKPEEAQYKLEGFPDFSIITSGTEISQIKNRNFA